MPRCHNLRGSDQFWYTKSVWSFDYVARFVQELLTKVPQPQKRPGVALITQNNILFIIEDSQLCRLY